MIGSIYLNSKYDAIEVLLDKYSNWSWIIKYSIFRDFNVPTVDWKDLINTLPDNTFEQNLVYITSALVQYVIEVTSYNQDSELFLLDLILKHTEKDVWNPEYIPPQGKTDQPVIFLRLTYCYQQQWVGSNQAKCMKNNTYFVMTYYSRLGK